MGNDILPNPDVIFPVPNIKTVTYVKPTIKNKKPKELLNSCKSYLIFAFRQKGKQ